MQAFEKGLGAAVSMLVQHAKKVAKDNTKGTQRVAQEIAQFLPERYNIPGYKELYLPLKVGCTDALHALKEIKIPEKPKEPAQLHPQLHGSMLQQEGKVSWMRRLSSRHMKESPHTKKEEAQDASASRPTSAVPASRPTSAVSRLWTGLLRPSSAPSRPQTQSAELLSSASVAPPDEGRVHSWRPSSAFADDIALAMRHRQMAISHWKGGSAEEIEVKARERERELEQERARLREERERKERDRRERENYVLLKDRNTHMLVLVPRSASGVAPADDDRSVEASEDYDDEYQVADKVAAILATEGDNSGDYFGQIATVMGRRVRNGLGQLKSRDGATHLGQWVSNVLQGFAIQIDIEGSYAIGWYEAGVLSGLGWRRPFPGAKFGFCGDFRNGQPCGLGFHVWLHHDVSEMKNCSSSNTVPSRPATAKTSMSSRPNTAISVESSFGGSKSTWQQELAYRTGILSLSSLVMYGENPEHVEEVSKGSIPDIEIDGFKLRIGVFLKAAFLKVKEAGEFTSIEQVNATGISSEKVRLTAQFIAEV